MAEEAAIGVCDTVVAQLVECEPEPQPIERQPLPIAMEDATPVQQGFKAEIEQVGAEPPPKLGQ